MTHSLREALVEVRSFLLAHRPEDKSPTDQQFGKILSVVSAALAAPADARDALRYRFLRDNPSWMGWEHDFRADEIDREVDRAIETSGEKPK